MEQKLLILETFFCFVSNNHRYSVSYSVLVAHYIFKGSFICCGQMPSNSFPNALNIYDYDYDYLK